MARKKRAAPEVTRQKFTDEAGEIVKEVLTANGSGIDMRITTTWDKTQGIEYAEIVTRRGKRTSSVVLKKDMATGKVLPSDDVPTLNAALAYARAAMNNDKGQPLERVKRRL